MIRPSPGLANVRYEIRGRLARRAHEMDRLGYDLVSLNIGNPGAFGFRTPETMRLAMIENLRLAEGYSHQKGIFPAREAVVMQQQNRGVMEVTADDVFMGNGVSECIDFALRALLAAAMRCSCRAPTTAGQLRSISAAVRGALPCPGKCFVPIPPSRGAVTTYRASW
jgi:alanine-synthesizing transaminase